MPEVRIGVDLGGTKIEAVAIDAREHVLTQRRIDTPQGDYQGTLAAIATLVTALEAEIARPASLGIGTPGSLSPATGLMRNSNSVWLNNRPLLEDLQALLQRDIRMANDADCFVLSEAVDGAAAAASTVFGVIIGTGTGGGFVVNRQLLAGCNGLAGEWGHNPLPWPSPTELPGQACYCGLSGCIETWLSGPALEREYYLESGERLSAARIAERDSVQDTTAVKVLDAYIDRLSRCLASVINVVDPQVIVLGGGIGNITRLYTDVPRYWAKYVFSDSVRTQLLPPKYGDASGVRGAARLWPLD